MGFIYKIQNKENNKIYIGKTVNTIHERWMEHLLDAKNGDEALLHKAIRKYGEDSFYVDEVEKCSGDALNEREQHYIQIFHSHCKEGGYNMTFGGEGA
jgi:group I intron endonuclease